MDPIERAVATLETPGALAENACFVLSFNVRS
jgi:hypothetical protein